VAVGKGTSYEANTYSLAGGKWSTGPNAAVALVSVSCPAATFCAAVGFLNYPSAFIFNGKSWSAQIRIDAEGSSISCPTTTFCVVGSTSGQVLYYRDGSWSKATLIDPHQVLSSTPRSP